MRLKTLVHFMFIAFSVLLSSKSVSAAASSAGGGGREKAVSYRISSGRSGILFDLGYYYGQSEAAADPAAGNEWRDITSIYDIKLGYVTDSDFYFGGGYSARTDSLSSQGISSASGGTPIVGLGWFWSSGFNARAYYRINEVFADYKNGTGFQADVGYMINLSSNFNIGLLFSHRQTTFTSNSTIVNFKSWTRKDTIPVLSFGFLIN